MNMLEKAELTTSIHHIERFYNLEVPNMAGKKQQEEEHRQLQSVMRFTQTQKSLNHV